MATFAVCYPKWASGFTEFWASSCAISMRTVRCWWVLAFIAVGGEDVFHQTRTPCFLLPRRDEAALRSLVASQRLQRAIGVIYRPDTERQSHYFYTRLAQQYDAVIHIDDTSAVEPLDVGPVWIDGEAPETFPSGI